MGRFINADAFPSTGQGLLGNNMFAYCGNNPVNCSDESGESWTLALAGGGTISSGLGLSLGSLINAVSASLAAVSPVGLAVAGVTVIACVAVYAYAKANDENQTGGRITSPIGRRKTFNTRKKAYESAKKQEAEKNLGMILTDMMVITDRIFILMFPRNIAKLLRV